MIRDLWCREIRFGHSKGVSTVIATIFLVIVVLSIFANVFIWTISQNNLYSQSVRESHQMDADRFSERIIAYNGNYSVSGSNVQVRGILANEGPVSAQILTLWVLDANSTEYNITDLRERNYNLNPGDTLPLPTIEVIIRGASSDHTFNSWFVTARGNLVPLQKKEVIIANVAQGIGSLAIEFCTFRYYNISGDKLVNYPAGNPTFKIPWGQTVAFGFNLTNFDPFKKTITFYEYSIMWSYFPNPAGQVIGPMWYIANVNPDGSIEATYSPISLAWGESKLFVFAKQAGDWAPKQKNTLGAINLLLYGTFEDGSEYAQNIPFVAIYAY